ncbi:hypothetical protein ACHAO1_010921 [Botrytis cinerea]
MAEFLAVVGGISAVLGTIDIIKKCYDAAKDKTGLPEAFREVKASLPIVKAILNSAHKYVNSKDMNKETCEAIEPLIAGCKEKADKLKEIFEKVMPEDETSRLERYIQAAKILGKCGKVEALMKGLMERVNLLASCHGMEAATASHIEQLTDAIEDLSNMEPSIPDAEFDTPSSMFNTNSGSGSMTNHQTNNSVKGNQKNQSNWSTGNAYQAETQNFGKND